MAGVRTIEATTFIREQHELIRELFDGVDNAPPGDRKVTFEPLVRLLAVHETAEELVIYPALERSGEDGTKVAAARKQEEDEAKKILADLEKMDPSQAGFAPKVRLFRVDVERHAQAEEVEVLPLLERITDREQLERMGKLLQVAEAMAPTHPHKAAPESMAGNLLVGPFVAMVDRVRDAITDAQR